MYAMSVQQHQTPSPKCCSCCGAMTINALHVFCTICGAALAGSEDAGWQAPVHSILATSPQTSAAPLPWELPPQESPPLHLLPQGFPPRSHLSQEVPTGAPMLPPTSVAFNGMIGSDIREGYYFMPTAPFLMGA
eukprot:TRINITY_DN84424_c0_g1_i1.p1 TRINITY_DN84424_c0_g1~~TRINITY_DN84424_c0_g1_i1.p1  ORF type:complete len:156 (+),score=19.91 TRINITY_DN84424_c0_g1_i1:69-470(+)